MGKNSEIQWTQATWNPWHGCKKVSPGCKYCYMYRDKDRYGQDPTTVLRSKSNFNAPLKWDEGKLIFTCSWSDWFIQEADEWRQDAWEVIRKSPQHTFQILTKRPERIHENLPKWFDAIADRVWIGVSVESQKQVNRLEYLVDLPCITFASFEPLIGEIEWNEFMSALDWCIIGGESGNETGKWRYRPMQLEWVEKLVNGAKANNVACFVKQLGTYQAKLLGLNDRHGGDISEFPDLIQVRTFPAAICL
jgi:protein gp37